MCAHENGGRTFENNGAEPDLASNNDLNNARDAHARRCRKTEGKATC
jgi:hypothetical protein